ncbi:1-acyl-sn-glycerol-3-phosphate acyltransferase [Rhodobacteraceae bacterium RKSG542]|uniref:lysophospholipid acyltransferase family protein n=1 Tax=Pseudovibrio flavus TaxID=2529854 RepID=UPI0012BB7000|nr:lysophospholipid acyltransferase family protein [Pseudovibrio flavus]MTI17903.1 1-acyl-sn-glycerol-3-phosphate acyltransferase [Pseudovibrio flavus]
MGSFRAVVVLILVTILSLVLIPIQWLALKFNWSIKRKLPLYWHQVTRRLMGIRVTQVGAMAAHRPLLITSNHISWLDIVVLGSVRPLSFIAKSEVAGWPIFGLFAKLQRSVFVNRSRRTDTRRVTREVAERMTDGDAMVLFAEGTSSNGNEVKPFRSAIIGAVHHAMDADGNSDTYVQPLSIAYTRLHGMPMGRQWRPHVAWYGDMDLPPHLWAILKEGGVDVTLTWGDARPIEANASRKALSTALEQDVRAMTITALTH